ncbi:MAG: penicillin acylase family protein [Alphaproteobacteria bacterium]|nr:penicillin acylase family protein [Alphaproteobacteria bacterium]
MKKIYSIILALFIIFAIIFFYKTSEANKNFDPESFIKTSNDYSYQINRDIYGVPHIYGASDKDTAFGFGFAQTEDDYKNIELVIKMARGELSDLNISFSSLADLFKLISGTGDIMTSISAIEGIELDYLIKFLNSAEVALSLKETVDQETLEYLQGYSDGINYWAALNPNKVDKSLFPTTVDDLLVGMVFRMPLFYGLDRHIEELINLMSDSNKELAVENELSDNQLVASIKSYFKPSGSNAFAVAKSRSSNDETMLVINSHQPLTGPVAWYEAHIKSDDGLNIMGGTFPGSPFIHVGFNEHLGWGATVNQPDLADIYELNINPENENQYLLDGTWKDLKVTKQVFKVKLFGPFSISYPIDMYFSDHGPVMKDGLKAYALRYVGMSDADQATAWLKMNKAKNITEWEDALKMQQIGSLNFVYADKEDNILFVHNMKSPKRSNDYDWKNILPGDASNLIWNDYYSYDEIPKILNPKSGYIYSTNQSPFFVTGIDDNLNEEDFPVSMGFQSRITNRAHRAFELLDNDKNISWEKLDEYKHDNKYSFNSRQYKFLQKIFEFDFKDDVRLETAQKFLQNWNLGTDSENLQAAFGVCVLGPEWLAEIKREPQPDPIKIFKDCIVEFEVNFNRLDIRWSEVSFLERGNKILPVQGGPDVLRAIYSPRSENGILKAVAGDGLYAYVNWDKLGKQQSFSIHQFGSSSTVEDSPHYHDQMELFVNEELKETFFN